MSNMLHVYVAVAYCNLQLMHMHSVNIRHTCAFTRTRRDKRTLNFVLLLFALYTLILFQQHQHPQIHHATMLQMHYSKTKKKICYHFSCDGTNLEVITNTRQPVPKSYPYCQSSHKTHPWCNTTNVSLLPNCEKA